MPRAHQASQCLLQIPSFHEASVRSLLELSRDQRRPLRVEKSSSGMKKLPPVRQASQRS